jgi:hypothetical protein
MYATKADIAVLCDTTELDRMSPETIDAMLDACETAIRHNEGNLLREDVQRVTALHLATRTPMAESWQGEPDQPQKFPRWKRLRSARLQRAAERRALMRGRRAALVFFATWSREQFGWIQYGPFPCSAEIVRSMGVEPRDGGWELAAKMTGRLAVFGLMRGFLRSPGYELGTGRGGGHP